MRKHNDQQKIEKNRKLLRGMLFLTVCALAVVQVFVLNGLSTAGAQLTQTEIEIDQIANKNEILEAKVASSSSMTMVFSRAKKIGLEKTPQTLSLTAPLPIAQIDKIVN